MTAPTSNVTDLVRKTQEELTAIHLTEDSAAQTRHRDNARIYALLADAQASRDSNDIARERNAIEQAKADALAKQNGEQRIANILAFLNSDREGWNADDEQIMRGLLGLGEATPAPEPTVPVQDTASDMFDVPPPNDVEPEPEYAVVAGGADDFGA